MICGRHGEARNDDKPGNSAIRSPENEQKSKTKRATRSSEGLRKDADHELMSGHNLYSGNANGLPGCHINQIYWR